MFFLVGTLLGCATTTPAHKFSNRAKNFGFESAVLKTKYFHHQLYLNQNNNKEILHVYLDGDGSPWIKNNLIASDPTSRNPLILKLMSQDDASAMMLGRPCYHGVGDPIGCHSRFWTSHRYSEKIVKSMVAALKQWTANRTYQKIVLIGYSGGGALAMLMAPYIDNIAMIVTIAANLNVSQWNTSHGYPPFKNSLNPADFIDTFRDIKQMHLAGAKDDVVPLSIIRDFATKSGRSKFIEYPEFDHICCWVDSWPKILTEIASEQFYF